MNNQKCKNCISQRNLTSYNQCICYGKMYAKLERKLYIEEKKLNQTQNAISKEIENFLNSLLVIDASQ